MRSRDCYWEVLVEARNEEVIFCRVRYFLYVENRVIGGDGGDGGIGIFFGGM